MQPLSRSTAAKHLTRLISRWPTDPIRPSSVSVQTYLQSRLSPPQQPQPSSSSGLLSSLLTKKPASQQPPATSTAVAQDAPLLSSQNINALYSLLENRYQREFPLPPSLRRPASNPEYYDNLLREFEEAPNRSWAGRLMKRVTGSLRLK